MAGALYTEVDAKDETNRCIFIFIDSLLIAKILIKWKCVFYYYSFIYCSLSIFKKIFRFIWDYILEYLLSYINIIFRSS